MKYIIGSGWWCGEDTLKNDVRVLYGDEAIRGKDFHELWYKSINENTQPEKIIIVDSNSPLQPDLKDDERIEFVSLNVNAGHASKHLGAYCGWTRGVILGLQYANLCDADYYVYVEQDVLLSGKGIIEHCIKKMNKAYMFGGGKGTPHALQQSFFIIRRDGMESFLKRYQNIDFNDFDISPESKFAIASSPLWSLVPAKLWTLKPGLTSLILKFFRSFEELPVGYGRSRPIEFDDDYFYFQHGSIDELAEYNVVQKNKRY